MHLIKSHYIDNSKDIIGNKSKKWHQNVIWLF